MGHFLAACDDVDGLLKALNIHHTPEEWKLFGLLNQASKLLGSVMKTRCCQLELVMQSKWMN